jgi:hypothetical protein
LRIAELLNLPGIRDVDLRAISIEWDCMESNRFSSIFKLADCVVRTIQPTFSWDHLHC